ncbi:MAG: hypothetical protein E7365_00675 [Clostridiales bacterium]|nr:hypothetical protein [Clostridiales bacterium]
MIRYFVGVPRSGKTTIACKIMKKHLRKKNFLNLKRIKYKYHFSNFETNYGLSNYFDDSMLGKFKLPEYSYIALDESGLSFNSRKFASLPFGVIENFKKHGHEHQDIDLFSQTWDDTDKQLRDLAEEIWVIRKIGPLSFARCVYKRIGIDEQTKQLAYQHYWKSILFQLLPFQPKQFIFCFRPLYYKYFDSFEPINMSVLPCPNGKEWFTTMNYLNVK